MAPPPLTPGQVDEQVAAKTRAYDQARATALSLLELVKNSDIVVQVEVTTAQAYQGELGGIATKYSLRLISTLKTVRTTAFNARNIVVNAGHLGDRITLSPEEPTIHEQQQYVLILRNPDENVLRLLQSRQVLRPEKDMIRYDGGMESWEGFQADLTHLGEALNFPSAP